MYVRVLYVQHVMYSSTMIHIKVISIVLITSGIHIDNGDTIVSMIAYK